jgi:hypothetical protein
MASAHRIKTRADIGRVSLKGTDDKGTDEAVDKPVDKLCKTG